MELLLLLVLTLTAYRLTRLLTRDELPLVRVPRDTMAHWLDPRDERGRPVEPAPLGRFGRSLAYLVECAWCTGVYVAGGLVWATDAAVGLPWPWLVWPAVAALVGLVSAAEANAERNAQLLELRIRQARRELARRGGPQEVEGV